MDNSRELLPKTNPDQSLSAFISILMLMVGLGGIIGGVWVAWKLMVDPDALIWVNQYLPKMTRLSETHRISLQTLGEIQTKLTQEGYYPGHPIPIKTAQYHDVILPVFTARPGCQPHGSPQCRAIDQLRVYRQISTPEPFVRDKLTYQLINQLEVKAPTEALVWKSLERLSGSGDRAAISSDRPLPLTSLKWSNSALVNSPSQQWLHLTGAIATEGKTILYGQLIYYNPNTTHISAFLSWTSPTNELPQWSPLPQTPHQPLLIINQTVDLEPRFQAYQLHPRAFLPAPVELQEVDFDRFFLNSRTYQEGVKLARSGLWTPALERFELALQSETAPGMALNAQLALVQRHAQESRKRADQRWASPSQQVLTQIIDGRWEEALAVYELPENQAEIHQLLATDQGVLWHRIQGAIALDPHRQAVIVWRSLLRSAQDGAEGGRAWLEKHQPPMSP